MKPLEFLPPADFKFRQVTQAIDFVKNDYKGTPRQVIDSLSLAGCKWIHSVDLDTAKLGPIASANVKDGAR